MKSRARADQAGEAFWHKHRRLLRWPRRPGSAAAAATANDRIGIGLIGVGGRGSDHRDELIRLATSQNVQITAVCDVWRKASQATAEKVAQKLGHEPRQFTRFGELLQQHDVDAVVIATPDFSHGTILTAAFKAGKDVYVEKPMTIDLASARQALELARAGSRIVQAGTQRRSDGHFRAAAKHIATGELGQISRVSAAVGFNEPRWKRATADLVEADVDWPAFLLHLPHRPFDAKLLRCWQLYRETSNGLPGLWMTHFADAVHMVTGASYPRAAVALGERMSGGTGASILIRSTRSSSTRRASSSIGAWGWATPAGGHFTVHGTGRPSMPIAGPSSRRTKARSRGDSRPSHRCRTWRTGWNACAPATAKRRYRIRLPARRRHRDGRRDARVRTPPNV